MATRAIAAIVVAMMAVMTTVAAEWQRIPELTVSYNQLVGLRPSRRPDWLRALLAEPTEDGYYSHVRLLTTSDALQLEVVHCFSRAASRRGARAVARAVV